MSLRIMAHKNSIAFLIEIIIILFAAFIVEALIFNSDAIETRGLVERYIDNSSIIDIERGVQIVGFDEPVSTVAIKLNGPQEITMVEIFIKDEASSASYARANAMRLKPGGESQVAYVKSNGNLRELQFTWDNYDAVIDSVSINRPIPFRFSLIRFSILCVPIIILECTRHYKLWMIKWNPSNRNQLLIYFLETILLVMLVFFVQHLTTPEDITSFNLTSTIDYPFTKSVYELRDNAHAVLFDALLHGGIIQEPPSKELMDLMNPYDPSERSANGVAFLFDYAFYKGHYYSYFGPTPVIIYYIPFYLLHGYLPSYVMAASFFSLLAVMFGMILFWDMLRYFINGEVSAISVLFMGPTFVLGCNILMLQSCADRYYLSILSGMAFAFLALWTGVRGTMCTKVKHGYLYFFISAISTFLALWARPLVMITIAVWLVPIFIYFLIECKVGSRQKIISAASYLVPVMLGGCLVMYYNYIRFESPFEFGQTWQLTIEDIHYNHIRIRDFWSTLYYYYLDPVQLTIDFPYIESTSHYVNHSGNYFYAPASMGAFSIPIATVSLLVFFNKHNIAKNHILKGAVLSTTIISAIEYATAGVSERYISDILPTLCLVGAIAICSICSTNDLEENKLVVIVEIIFWFTFAFAFFSIFSNYRKFVMKYNPDIYLYYLKLFQFY